MLGIGGLQQVFRSQALWLGLCAALLAVAGVVNALA
jgi:hypothetical protein